MKKISHHPAQCPACYGKLKKKRGAYKVIESGGFTIKWFHAQCGDCGQRVKIRESWKKNPAEIADDE